MNGGAWLTVEGEKVDLLYRDLEDVARWTAEAEQGLFELFRMPGCLCGMPSYVLVGETASQGEDTGSNPVGTTNENPQVSAIVLWRLAR
jgi:hypothetical protein